MIEPRQASDEIAGEGGGGGLPANELDGAIRFDSSFVSEDGEEAEEGAAADTPDLEAAEESRAKPAPIEIDTNQKPPETLPWYKRPSVRFVVIRVIVRLISIAIFVAILKIFGSTIKSWGEAYLAWIRSLGVVGGPLAFLVVATVFSGISPTGYLPSVAAGVTFPYEVSIPLSYASTFLGALFNLFLVRIVIHGLSPYIVRCKPSCCNRSGGAKRKERNRRRGWTKGLIQAILTHPVRMTLLVRLPFLGNGSLNWFLSASKIPVLPMVIGNAIGMLPGSIVFAVLGMQIRSLASMIAEGHAEPTAIGMMVGLSVVCSLSLLGVIFTTRRVMKKHGLGKEEEEGKEAAPATPTDAEEARPLHLTSPRTQTTQIEQQERLMPVEPVSP